MVFTNSKKITSVTPLSNVLRLQRRDVERYQNNPTDAEQSITSEFLKTMTHNCNYQMISIINCLVCLVRSKRRSTSLKASNALEGHLRLPICKCFLVIASDLQIDVEKHQRNETHSNSNCFIFISVSFCLK